MSVPNRQKKSNVQAKSIIMILLVLVILVIILAACSNPQSSKDAGKNAVSENKSINDGMSKMVNSQQAPSFDYSQERQTLIDTYTIRATGAVSTTAVYVPGVGLIGWCPSFGAPIPSTYQLTGKTQYADIPGDDSKKLFPLDQAEPTGIYPGDSQGTWILCLDDEGKKFAHYAEGIVDTTVGVVDSYPKDKQYKLSASTFDIKDEGG